MTNDVNFRFATEMDIRHWYGSIPGTMRAVVLEVDDEAVMICGVMHRPDHYMAFMDMRPKARNLGLSIMKTTKTAIRDVFSHYTQPIFAVVDDELESAPRFLKRIGFLPVKGRDGIVIYYPNNYRKHNKSAASSED
ncbi:hypothetical protein [Yersinia enterocolitica]|uniref:hypothetical protein n=1 Tax=Yersinia enterocolitica TaxID=630 RepID=UPI002AC6B222|nr:hypothetical protein [Yersinia enterocolitica]